MQELSSVGKRIPKIDAVDKATGRSQYIQDLKLPGMLWGKILYSKFPHARIAKIDTSKAKALLDENSNANEEEIKEAIAGNLCRCTGYVQIIDSIKSVSGYYRQDEPQVVAWKTEEGDRGE